jgi:hypothetical protein
MGFSSVQPDTWSAIGSKAESGNRSQASGAAPDDGGAAPGNNVERLRAIRREPNMHGQ